MSKQILTALLNCSWQWGLLVGFIWLLSTRLRQSNTAYHAFWLLTLISLPILFGLNQVVPGISINSIHTEPTQDQSNVTLSATKNQVIEGNHMLTEENRGWIDGLLCLWTIGVLMMLAHLLSGLHRINQLQRSATMAGDSYQTICLQLTQQMKIDRPVTVCFSNQILSPISFGWKSPHILIPPSLSLEQFELVAVHELAHIGRLDWLTNLFSHLVGAIFFFHPLYHLLSRQLAKMREQICDDWVIRLTGARKNYAQCLLDLNCDHAPSIPLALALNQPSQLQTRIGSILKTNRRLDLQPKPRFLLMAATVLLTSLPLLAMAQLVPLRTVQLSLFSQTANTSEDSDSNNLSAPAVEGTYNLVIDRSKKKRIEGYGKAEAEIMKETKAGRITKKQASERLESLRRRLRVEEDDDLDQDKHKIWYKKAEAEIVAAAKAGRITKREARTRLEALKEKLWGDDDKDGYYNKAEARDWLDYLRKASAEEGKKAINTEKFRHLPVEAQRVIIEASGFKLNAVGVVKVDKTNKKEAEIMKIKAMVKAGRITKKQADAKLEFLNKAKLKS